MFTYFIFLNLCLSCTIAQSSRDEGRDGTYYTDVPPTSFSCENQKYAGYYSDPEAHCQAFHICVRRHNKLEEFSFLCPNETVFHQQLLVCVWWDSFDCSSAPSLYYINEDIFEDAGHSKLEAHVGENRGKSVAADHSSSKPEGRTLTTDLTTLGKSFTSEIGPTIETKPPKSASVSPTSRIGKTTQPKLISLKLKSDPSPKKTIRTKVTNSPVDIVTVKPPVRNTTPNIRTTHSAVPTPTTTKKNISKIVDVQKEAAKIENLKKSKPVFKAINNPTQLPKKKVRERVTQRVNARRDDIKTAQQPTPSPKHLKKSKPVFQTINNPTQLPKQKVREQVTQRLNVRRDEIKTTQQPTPSPKLRGSRKFESPSRKKENVKFKNIAPQTTVTTNLQSVSPKTNTNQIFRKQNTKPVLSTLKTPQTTPNIHPANPRTNVKRVSLDRKVENLSTQQTPFKKKGKKISSSIDSPRKDFKSLPKLSSTPKPKINNIAKTTPVSKTALKSINKSTAKKGPINTFSPARATKLSTVKPTPVPSKNVGKQLKTTSARRPTTTKPSSRRPFKSTVPTPSKRPANKNLSKGLTAYDILQDFLKNVTIIRSESLTKSDSGTRGNVRRNRRVNSDTGFNSGKDKIVPSQLHSIHYENTDGFRPSTHFNPSSDNGRGISSSKKQNIKYNNSNVNNKKVYSKNKNENKITATSSTFPQTQSSGYIPSTKSNLDVTPNSDEKIMKCMYTYGTNQLSGCNFIDPITENFQKLVVNEIFTNNAFHIPVPTSQIKNAKPKLYSKGYLSSVSPPSSLPDKETTRSSYIPSSKRNSLPTAINKILNVSGSGVPLTIPRAFALKNASSPFPSNEPTSEQYLSPPSFTSSEKKSGPFLIISRADAESNNHNQKKVYLNTIKSKDKKPNTPFTNPFQLDLPRSTLFPNTSPPHLSTQYQNTKSQESSWSSYASPTESESDETWNYGFPSIQTQQQPQDSSYPPYGDGMLSSIDPDHSYGQKSTPANGLYK